MIISILLIPLLLGIIVGVIVTILEVKKKNWPIASAIISSSEVIQDYGTTKWFDNYTAMQMGMLGLAYSIELSYTYEVNGHRYSGKSIKLKTDKRISKDQAENRVKEFYEKEKSIQVYYDPMNPGTSRLDKGDVSSGPLIIVWSVILIGGLMLLLSIDL